MNTYRYLIFTGCFIAVIMSGCREPQTSSVKQSRLIAVENMELQKQIEQLNAQIEILKAQQQKDLLEHKNLLAKAQKEIEAWKKQSQQNVREQVQGVLDSVIAENSDLRKEIEKLNGWLETQRKQITELENMLKEKSKE
jgi:chromosome segregation ATPase